MDILNASKYDYLQALSSINPAKKQEFLDRHRYSVGRATTKLVLIGEAHSSHPLTISQEYPVLGVDMLVILGVCGGIAKEYNMDPTLVRVLMFLFTLTVIGLLGYIVIGLIIPEEP